MGPTNKKRLLLLCGASALALQVAAAPFGFDGDGPGPMIRAAHAQEQSCFTAGTMILMADGTERPIQSIRAGDLVVGRRGRVNRVRGCERTRLGRRRLHALNGGRPFVTAEHPFLTTEGWKALDPEVTRRESPGLAISALQLGDQLCRGTARAVGGERRSMPSAPGLLFLQSTVALETLASTEAEPDTPLFNLLLDGDHSYVADGWIVHNKDAVTPPAGAARAPTAEAAPAARPPTAPPPVPTPERPAARAVARRRMAARRATVGRRTAVARPGVATPRGAATRPAAVPPATAGRPERADRRELGTAARRRIAARPTPAELRTAAPRPATATVLAPPIRQPVRVPPGEARHKAVPPTRARPRPAGRRRAFPTRPPPDPSRAPGPPRPGPLRRAPRPRPRSVWSTPSASTTRPTRASGRPALPSTESRSGS